MRMLNLPNFPNTHMASKHGQTPLDLAIRKNCTEIIELLKEDILRREQENK